MPTTFPGALDIYTTKQDYVHHVLGAHINDPQDAIRAIEAKVGIDESADPLSLDYFRKRPMGIRDASRFAAGSSTGGIQEAFDDLPI